MKIAFAVAAVFLLAGQAECLAASQNGTRTQGPYHDYLVEAQLDTAKAAAEMGNFELVIGALALSLEPKVYSQLSPGRQHEIVALYGFAAVQIGDWKNAQEAYKVATENPEASVDDWGFRLLIARTLRDADDAFSTVKHLRARWPEFISELTLDWVADLDEQFSSLADSGRTRFEFGEILDEASW